MPTAAIAVVVATIVVDYLAARYLGRVARTYGSYALEADAFHFSTDLWAKGAALTGLLGGRLGAEWLDPAAALAVAAVMVYTAARLGLRTSLVLLDTAPSAAVEGEVRRILAEEMGPGTGYHSLRMRQAGKWVHLDVALDLPGHVTLAEAHDLACRISRRLCQEVPEVRDAVVYVEPYSHHQEPETDRVSGPLTMQWENRNASSGPHGIRPCEGFRPTRPVKAAGMRTEPPPSEAVASGTMPPAMAAEEPPLEPPGVRSRFQGFRVGPKTRLWVNAV